MVVALITSEALYFLMGTVIYLSVLPISRRGLQMVVVVVVFPMGKNKWYLLNIRCTVILLAFLESYNLFTPLDCYDVEKIRAVNNQSCKLSNL